MTLHFGSAVKIDVKSENAALRQPTSAAVTWLSQLFFQKKSAKRSFLVGYSQNPDSSHSFPISHFSQATVTRVASCPPILEWNFIFFPPLNCTGWSAIQGWGSAIPLESQISVNPWYHHHRFRLGRRLICPRFPFPKNERPLATTCSQWNKLFGRKVVGLFKEEKRKRKEKGKRRSGFGKLDLVCRPLNTAVHWPQFRETMTTLLYHVCVLSIFMLRVTWSLI